MGMHLVVKIATFMYMTDTLGDNFYTTALMRPGDVRQDKSVFIYVDGNGQIYWDNRSK